VSRLRAAGITDPGQVRGQNQDTFLVGDDLILIADGMGGYAGGEVAAEIAAEVVGQRFADESTARGLTEAVQFANRTIFERGGQPGLEGMGTTLVAAAIVTTAGGERLLIANVGDSRGYLLRDGVLRQLTEDHSVAAELVRMGRIEEDEEVEHPGRHVLTRALGVAIDVVPDVVELEPRDGDRLLLCSDGLSNELGEPELHLLLEVGEPSDAARALVAAANAHGGLDNITAVVADVADVAPASTSAPVEVPAAAPVAASSVADDAPLAPPPAPPHAPPEANRVDASDAGPATTQLRTAPPVASIPIRPVLAPKEQRRRRREERRARRAHNKWVSFRGAAFLILLAAVFVGGYGVLRWYGTENYVVAIRGHHIVVLRGQQGGFLWWPDKVVVIYPFGTGQVLGSAVPAITAGVDEPTLLDARHYVDNMHQQWKVVHGYGTTTTTTTTTYSQFEPTGTG
jgi:protein phosphatase